MRGHIRKHGSGWQYTIELGKDPTTGKRLQKSKGGFKTKKECEKTMASLIHELETGQFIKTETMSLKDYLNYWLETYAKVNVANSTFIRYKQFADNIIKYLGLMHLQKLKPANIQKYYSTLIEETSLSKSTILKIHRMLHIALKHAVNWQMINTNPCDYVTAPKPDKVDISVWDAETASKFINDIKETSIYLPILLALNTGMRQGEICALKWCDINNNTISVKYTLQNIAGELVLKEPKTKNSIRTITIIDALIKELEIIKELQAKNKKLLGDTYLDDDFICCWDNGKAFDPNYVSKKFFKLVRQLDYPIIRFHDLRHYVELNIMVSDLVEPLNYKECILKFSP